MLKQLYLVAVTSRLITIGLAILTYYFTGSYDSSAEIQLETTSKHVLNVFLRWDALYFLHIAEHGYIYEQETAFFPVLPLLSRALTHSVFLPLRQILGTKYTLLLSGVTIANVSFVLAAGALYKLTLALLPGNKRLAYMSSIAFCLSPPAMFMSSFYTESLFAFLTFTGMTYIAQKKYFTAALLWGITSAIRSNAIIYSGFFYYDLIWTRLIKRQHITTGILKSILYTLTVCSGFVFFQYLGYQRFCSLDRQWCTEKIPLLYSFVQKEYWGNGFLAYYEMKQIPNFLLAAPIIALSVLGLKEYVKSNPSRFLSIGLMSGQKSTTVEDQSYTSPKLSVYMYLWVFLLLYVVTSMHIQVIIRFFTSLPPLYWFVGDVWIKAFKEKRSVVFANIILGYFVFYGLTGIVLFSSFLPPA
ncbi:hypothetical protein INT47_013077 [Mucor saturninus]|uniref:GPI mannosyltransferase 2 n=1 Tax=Mucor saturninus TaxID=64648 RepID=A0A8H7UXM9_9FUNG|nr:hypothetical protein INT47_013077 [Mucor saturninus]